ERQIWIEPYGLAGGRQVPRREPFNIGRQRLRRTGDQSGDVGHVMQTIDARARNRTEDRVQQSMRDDLAGRTAGLTAGPTASGRSALALAVAERIGGAIVNTDSMQVYRDLSIITARPGAAETARVPHLLYGHVDAADNYSAGRFVDDAAAAFVTAR